MQNKEVRLHESNKLVDGSIGLRHALEELSSLEKEIKVRKALLKINSEINKLLLNAKVKVSSREDDYNIGSVTWEYETPSNLKYMSTRNGKITVITRKLTGEPLNTVEYKLTKSSISDAVDEFIK